MPRITEKQSSLRSTQCPTKIRYNRNAPERLNITDTSMGTTGSICTCRGHKASFCLATMRAPRKYILAHHFALPALPRFSTILGEGPDKYEVVFQYQT